MWPAAQTDELLAPITHEFVLGIAGCQWAGLKPKRSRCIDGISRSFQPVSAAHRERDMVWLSPEAAAIVQGVSVYDIFIEHAVVEISLSVPGTAQLVSTWPLECR